MTDNLDEESVLATANREMSAKQRKVRKGTRSCWECKRRKIRCIFPSSGDATCIGCQRRHAPCVSQDLPETLSPARKGNRCLSERIARVEDVVKGLAVGTNIGTSSRTGEESRQARQYSQSDVLRAPAYALVPAVRAPPTPADSYSAYTPHTSLPLSDSPAISSHSGTDTTGLHPLWTSFPIANDLEVILKEYSRSSRYTSLVNLQPHNKLTYKTLNAPYPTAELPLLNAHPLVLSNRMLMFAITLQSPCEEDFLGLSEPPSLMSRRLVTAATTWLSSKIDTNNTVDDLVCIILEAIFETNCGNLRRAWIVYRKAMTIAQMMGLHRSTMPPLKRVDATLDADPRFMWFRIVYMDRFLSLLLGLPQGTLDKDMGTAPVLQDQPPLGQFERQLTIIASSILERNEDLFGTGDTTKTLAVDTELLRVSKNMPTSFWRPVDYQNLILGSPESLLETVRLSAQVYYYGLLIQLHLPYMVHRTGKDIEHEYSRITCVSAGREIITRFIAHRSFNPKSSCSRPVDFYALLAAMTLLLAHLDAHHHQESTNLLAHQRFSDRAILEQALERMDAISDVGKDIIVEKSAVLIRQLLDVEADATDGNNYVAGNVERDEGDMHENIGDQSGTLRLHIPHFGIIKITRRGLITREPPTSQDGDSLQVPAPTTSNDVFASSPHASGFDEQHLLNIHSTNQDSAFSRDPQASESLSIQPLVAGYDEQWNVDDWTFQGVDIAFFDSLMRGTS